MLVCAVRYLRRALLISLRRAAGLWNGSKLCNGLAGIKISILGRIKIFYWAGSRSIPGAVLCLRSKYLHRPWNGSSPAISHSRLLAALSLALGFHFLLSWSPQSPPPRSRRRSPNYHVLGRSRLSPRWCSRFRTGGRAERSAGVISSSETPPIGRPSTDPPLSTAAERTSSSLGGFGRRGLTLEGTGGALSWLWSPAKSWPAPISIAFSR